MPRRLLAAQMLAAGAMRDDLVNKDRSGDTRARALKGMAKAIASAVVVGV
ncbi:MAG: hypothetical protein VB144_01240 [Clostridia bacterium]|nr:hypothetical protein [Clostridia bacterium]